MCSQVKYWITFNEPWLFTLFGYDDGTSPPGIKNSGYGGYQTAHVVIKAHAEAWHLYNDSYRGVQQGVCH